MKIDKSSTSLLILLISFIPLLSFGDQIEAGFIDGTWQQNFLDMWTSVNNFDNSLGTLEAVSIDYLWTINNYQVTGTWPDYYGYYPALQLFAPLTMEVVSNPESMQGPELLSSELETPELYYYSISPGQTATLNLVSEPFPLNSDTWGTPVDITDPQILSEFTGPGEPWLYITMEPYVYFYTGMPSGTSYSASFSLQCEIDYIYAVPEPSCLALLSLGLLLLRRRKS